MRYAKIVENSRVDGPGLRTALFLQGCSIHCKGCQNKDLWDKVGGHDMYPLNLAKNLIDTAKGNDNITITGGEPFDQARDLEELVSWIRKYTPQAHIIIYSGYTIEELLMKSKKTSCIKDVLEMIDVLVDGSFQAENDDPFITYRGSRNQRPIDIPATFRTGTLTLLDWNSPEIILMPEGIALMPEGLAPEFADLGDAEATRRCGEQKGM